MNVNEAFSRRFNASRVLNTPIPEIVARLTEDVTGLARHLLPNGRRAGPGELAAIQCYRELWPRFRLIVGSSS